MKITAQEEYGLRCLLRLAKADSGSITLPEVAAAEGLSVPYVAKLMAVLRHAGLLESVRGRSGGYSLAKPAEDIGLGSLLLILGEPLFDEHEYCQKHAGTEAPNGPPAGWSHLVIKSLPRVRQSEIPKIPTNSFIRGMIVDRTKWRFTVFATDVIEERQGAHKRFKLRAVGLGLGAKMDGKELVLTIEGSKKNGCSPPAPRTTNCAIA